MTGAIAFALVVILAGIGLTAVLTVLRAGLPSLASRVDAAAARRSGLRRLAIGLLNGPVLFFLAAAFGDQARSKPLSALFLLALVVLSVLGLTAEVPAIGRRVLALGKRETSDLAHVLAGGAAVTGCFLVPVVGWAVCAVVLLTAIGTGVSSLFLPRARPPSQAGMS